MSFTDRHPLDKRYLKGRLTEILKWDNNVTTPKKMPIEDMLAALQQCVRLMKRNYPNCFDGVLNDILQENAEYYKRPDGSLPPITE